MERYGSYRMSEIPCLGSVPAHWKSSKFKFHHFEEDDTVGEYSDDYPLLSLTKEGVVFRDVESGKGKFPASFENYKVVHPDRLIFCLFDIDETPRTIGLSNHFGMITGAYKLFRTTHDLNPRFSLYTFLVIDNVKGLKPYYTGLRKVVRPETFKSLEFTLPPLHEQEQIVEYLDRKTTLIDSLIEKTVRKIELLKEKRTSLINEVVTKGLNPDVEMKDSGVEWIGEIPSHWSVKRLQWISNIENSGVWGEDDPFEGANEVPIPTTAQLSIEGRWDYDGMAVRYLSDEEKDKYLCRVGDIIVVKSSGSATNIITGKCGYIGEGDNRKFGFSNFLLRVRTNEKFHSRFTYFFLQSNLTKQRIERMVSATTYPNLKVDEYVKSELTFPPLNEQEHIVEYLDEQTSIIDSTITTEEKRIELLKEYRQSLISEVVTGKVKVTRDE